MKNNYPNFFASLFILCLLAPLHLAACDLSELQLNSVTDLNNGKYEIDMTFCTGGGQDPGNNGADQNTATFAFILFGGATFDSYPNSLVSPQTNAIYTPNLWNVDTLIYNNPSEWWACLGGCGPVQAVCQNITIISNGLPSSIFLIGMEGAGNPYASCMGPDMYVYPDGNAPDPCELTTMSTDLGNDQTVYFGWDPESCAYLCPITSGNYSHPLSYAWSNGETSPSFDVCPETTTTYTVTVTDDNGCTATDEITVEVIDVRCGNKNNKVLMCKPNNTTRCVRQNKVQQKLNEGWTLGPCTANAKGEYQAIVRTNFFDDLDHNFLSASPSLFMESLELTIGASEHIEANLINFQGQLVKKLFKGETSGEIFQQKFDTSSMEAGSYILQVIVDQEKLLTRKLVKIN